MMTEADAMRMVTGIKQASFSRYGLTAAGALVMRSGSDIFILINSDLPQDEQEFSLHHELAHIRLGHLFEPPELRPQQEREDEANALARKEMVS